MPKVIYISSVGEQRVIDVDAGSSAMQAAVDHRVPGIDGDCGGVAACGTCHVWVDATWTDKVGPAQPGGEADMLALTDGCTPQSRLACQITVTDALDGLILRMPTAQH